MNNSKAKKIFQKIALEKGVSVTEVREEIKKALEEGMKNPDPEVQAYWKKIPCRGIRPTPEEVVVFLNKEVKKKM